jgi:hypothetical protein
MRHRAVTIKTVSSAIHGAIGNHRNGLGMTANTVRLDDFASLFMSSQRIGDVTQCEMNNIIEPRFHFDVVLWDEGMRGMTFSAS